MLFISVLGFLVHVIYLPMMCQPKYLPNILWIFEYMSWQRLQKCAGTCTLKGGIMLKNPLQDSQDFARIHNLVAVGPMSITNTDGIILKPLHLEFIRFDWYIWLRWESHLYSSGFQVFSIYYYPVPSQIRWIVGEKFSGDEKMTEKIKGTPPGRSYYNYQGVTRTLIWC